MNTEVTTQNKMMTVADSMAELGVSADDINIPRLMLMQNTSEFVGDGKAKLGDVVNSQTLEVVGSTEKPVEMVPLTFFKTWRTYRAEGDRKLISIEPWSALNSRKTFEENVEGEIRRNYLTFNFLVLLKKDIDSGEAFPATILFKSTGLQAGKALATHFVKQAAFGKKSYDKTVLLTVTKQKKETNTYAVFGISPGHAANDEAKEAANRWLGMLSTKKVSVDDHESDSLNPSVEDAPF